MKLFWMVVVVGCLLGPDIPDAQADEPPTFQGKRRPYTQVTPAYPAPTISWQKPKGGITNITRYQGKVLVLNFWATWCPACLHEMPDLDKLTDLIDHPEFEVVTVNLDEANRANVKSFFERLNVKTLPLLSDPLLKSIDAYSIREGLPWSFLIDRSGNVRGYLMGAAHWLGPESQSLIRYYLNE